MNRSCGFEKAESFKERGAAVEKKIGEQDSNFVVDMCLVLWHTIEKIKDAVFEREHLKGGSIMNVKKSYLITLLVTLGLIGWIFLGCSDKKEENQVVDLPEEIQPVPYEDLTGSIHGVVRSYATKTPIVGAMVHLTYDNDGDGTANPVMVLTDAGGQYIFQNVPVTGSLAGGWGNDRPYNITVRFAGGAYQTAYPEAYLTYDRLLHEGAMEVQDQMVFIIDDLMVEADEVEAARGNVEIFGTIQEEYTAEPVEGATVAITQGEGGTAPCEVPNQYAMTGANGDFVLVNVPEGAPYKITLSKVGYENMTIDLGLFGAGPIKYDVLDGNPIPLKSGFNPGDINAPFVRSMDIASMGYIPNGAASYAVEWSEEMDTDNGAVRIHWGCGDYDYGEFDCPHTILTNLTWDADGKNMTVAPAEVLPEGIDVWVEFKYFTDVNKNAHTGQQHLDPDDIIFPMAPADFLDAVSDWDDENDDGLIDEDETTFVTAFETWVQGTVPGDAPSNLTQLEPELPDPMDQGGVAVDFPLANNENLFGGPNNVVRFEWDPPATMTVRSYELEANLIVPGRNSAWVPVKSLGEVYPWGDLGTESEVSLDEIETAIDEFDGPEDFLPHINDYNDTTEYFDEGFGCNDIELKIRIKAISTEGIAGTPSVPKTVCDNTPPVIWSTFFDDGFIEPCLDCPEPTFSPFIDLDYDNFKCEEGLDALENEFIANAYHEGDWEAFVTAGGLVGGFDIRMNEDLLRGQTPTLDPEPGLPYDIIAFLEPDGAGDMTVDTIGAVISSGKITEVATWDKVSLDEVRDEAGNKAIVDIVDPIEDHSNTFFFRSDIGPIVTSATAKAAVDTTVVPATWQNSLSITFSEDVDEEEVVDPDNYEIMVDGNPDVILQDDTFTYDAATRTVTIDEFVDDQVAGADEEYQKIIRAIDQAQVTTLKTFVHDLEEDANAAFIGFAFLVDDEIPPKVENFNKDYWRNFKNLPDRPATFDVVIEFSEPIVWDLTKLVYNPEYYVLPSTKFELVGATTPSEFSDTLTVELMLAASPKAFPTQLAETDYIEFVFDNIMDGNGNTLDGAWIPNTVHPRPSEIGEPYIDVENLYYWPDTVLPPDGYEWWTVGRNLEKTPALMAVYFNFLYISDPVTGEEKDAPMYWPWDNWVAAPDPWDHTVNCAAYFAPNNADIEIVECGTSSASEAYVAFNYPVDATGRIAETDFFQVTAELHTLEGDPVDPAGTNPTTVPPDPKPDPPPYPNIYGYDDEYVGFYSDAPWSVGQGGGAINHFSVQIVLDQELDVLTSWTPSPGETEKYIEFKDKDGNDLDDLAVIKEIALDTVLITGNENNNALNISFFLQQTGSSDGKVNDGDMIKLTDDVVGVLNDKVTDPNYIQVTLMPFEIDDVTVSTGLDWYHQEAAGWFTLDITFTNPVDATLAENPSTWKFTSDDDDLYGNFCRGTCAGACETSGVCTAGTCVGGEFDGEACPGGTDDECRGCYVGLPDYSPCTTPDDCLACVEGAIGSACTIATEAADCQECVAGLPTTFGIPCTGHGQCDEMEVPVIAAIGTKVTLKFELYQPPEEVTTDADGKVGQLYGGSGYGFDYLTIEGLTDEFGQPLAKTTIWALDGSYQMLVE